jgi:hypothetical protein
MSSADAMERYVQSVTILTSSPEEVSDEQLLVSEAAFAAAFFAFVEPAVPASSRG